VIIKITEKLKSSEIAGSNGPGYEERNEIAPQFAEAWQRHVDVRRRREDGVSCAPGGDGG
jgi:hypothetical protein